MSPAWAGPAKPEARVVCGQTRMAVAMLSLAAISHAVIVSDVTGDAAISFSKEQRMNGRTLMLACLLSMLTGCQVGGEMGVTDQPGKSLGSAPETAPLPTAPVSLPPPWLVFTRESCAGRCVDYRISLWPDGSFRWQRLAVLSAEQSATREQAGHMAATDLQRLRDGQAELERQSASLVLRNGRPDCPEIVRDQPLLMLQRLTPAPGWKLLLGSCRGHAGEAALNAGMQDIANLFARYVDADTTNR